METFNFVEYAYTMKVTEKSDIYSYGVVLLELLTGKAPVQPIDQGGDVVSWVRSYIRRDALSSGVLDARLKLEDERIVSHMLNVLKIALLCTSVSPVARPSMRQVVLMLIESDRQEGDEHTDTDWHRLLHHDAILPIHCYCNFFSPEVFFLCNHAG